MLRIEVNCTLLLLALFLVSMLGSLTHADINAVYALFAFYALVTHPQYNSIRQIVVILIAVSVVVLLADVWTLALLGSEGISAAMRGLAYVWTVLEMGLKIWLIVLLALWKKHLADEDAKRE